MAAPVVPYGHHGAPSGRRRTQQSANMLRDMSTLLKLEYYL